MQFWGLSIAQKIWQLICQIQHAQIRLDDISEHFYQQMHSHVAFCVIYTSLLGPFWQALLITSNVRTCVRQCWLLIGWKLLTDEGELLREWVTRKRVCLGIPETFSALASHQGVTFQVQLTWNNWILLLLLLLNPRVDIPLFDTNANPLQLYHSPRAKFLTFNNNNDDNKNYL